MLKNSRATSVIIGACSQTNPKTVFDERTNKGAREGILNYDAVTGKQ
jgi:hypothetical protein